MKRSHRLSVVVGLVVALMVAATAWVLWRYVLPDAEADAAADRQGEAEAIVAAKTAVAARNPDADTLTFGKITVRWQGEDPAVCGEVDIEEEQDSLSGEERFVYLDGDLVLESKDGTAALDQKWDDICKAT
jgi:hypothetical protein